MKKKYGDDRRKLAACNKRGGKKVFINRSIPTNPSPSTHVQAYFFPCK